MATFTAKAQFELLAKARKTVWWANEDFELLQNAQFWSNQAEILYSYDTNTNLKVFKIHVEQWWLSGFTQLFISSFMNDKTKLASLQR